MTGTQGRRQPMGRMASSVVRRAPVGSGTPGVSGVRRRDGSQALTVPPAPSAGSTSGLIVAGTSSWSLVDSWGDVSGWTYASFPGIGLTAGAYQVGMTVGGLSVAAGKYVLAELSYQFTGAASHSPPGNVVQGQVSSIEVSVAGAFHLDADDSYAIDFFVNRYTSATGVLDTSLSPYTYMSLVRLSD